MPYEPVSIYFDSNRVLTEHRRIAGEEVVVHYDDIPESDCTVVHGIPCTTALRTVIDVAPELDPRQLHRVLRDCLNRGLFSVDEMLGRLAQSDTQARSGAALLRPLLRYRSGDGHAP